LLHVPCASLTFSIHSLQIFGDIFLLSYALSTNGSTIYILIHPF